MRVRRAAARRSCTADCPDGAPHPNVWITSAGNFCLAQNLGMADRPELPPVLAGRSFTVHEGRASGVMPSRLRAKDLWRPSREIRVPKGASQTLLDRVRPYTALGIETYVSHSTAALLYGIPLPRSLEKAESIHLTRPSEIMMPRRRGVVGHKRALSVDEVVFLNGVPVTAPARTWLDLSVLLAMEDLVAAGDYLVCEHDRYFEEPKPAIVELGMLQDYYRAKRGLRGLQNARAALGLIRVGVDSPPETRLRLMLLRAGLPEFVPDYKIEGNAGERPVHTDLGCKDFKVCGEYEGEIHLTPEKQLADRNRDQRTRERGWMQVKVFNDDMKRGEKWVVGLFRQALVKQGWAGS